MNASAYNRPPRARRVLRIVVSVLLGLAVALVLTVSAVLVPPTRAWILARALPYADRALPGDLVVSRAAWPAPGTLRFEGVAWTDGDAALVAARAIEISVDLPALLSRDIDVSRLTIDAAEVDVPAIMERFAGGTHTTAPQGAAEGKASFPRAGSMHLLPSIGVRHLTASADTLRLPGAELSAVYLSGTLVGLHGEPPHLHVDRLSAADARERARLDSLTLDVDPAARSIAGDAVGTVDDVPFALHVSSSGQDRVRLTLSTPGRAFPPQGEGITIDATLQGFEFDVEQADFDATIRVPDATILSHFEVLKSAAPNLAGLAFGASGTVVLEPAFSLRATATLIEHSELDTATVALSCDNTGLVVDHLFAAARGATLTAGGRTDFEQVSGHFILGYRGINVGATAQTSIGADIDVSLSPMLVSTAPIEPAALGKPDRVVVRYRADPRTLSLAGLQIRGDGGNIRVDLSMDPTEHIAYDIRASWPRFPDVVLVLADIPEANTLKVLWQRGAPYDLSVSGHVAGLPPTSVDAEGSFNLPGPDVLSPLLPDSARVAGLGTLAGTFRGTLNSEGNHRDADVTLDLAATTWIDAGLIDVAVRDSLPSIRRLQIDALGLSADVRGNVTRERIDIEGTLAVRDSLAIRHFIPHAPVATLAAKGYWRGTLSRPDADLTFEAKASDTRWTVPVVRGSARIEESSTNLRLRFPGGFRVDDEWVDSLTVDAVVPDVRSLFPAAVVLDAAADRIALHQSVHIDSAGGWRADVDDFDLTVVDRDLHATSPFSVGLAHDRTITVDALSLRGTMGHIELSGTAGADSIDASGSIALSIPDAVLKDHLSRPFRPSSVETVFRIAGGSMSLDATVNGLQLPDGSDAVLEAKARQSADSTVVIVDVSNPTGAFIDVSARVPVRITAWPPRIARRGDVVRGDITLDQVPLAFYLLTSSATIRKEQVAKINGRVKIRGTPEAPAGTSSLTMVFPDWPKMADYRATLAATLSKPAWPVEGAAVVDDSLGSKVISAGDFQATVRVEHAETPILSLDTTLPLVVFNPFAIHLRTGVERALTINATNLDFSDLDPMLPADVALKGIGNLKIDTKGPVGSATISGSFSTRDLEVSVARKSTVAARADLKLSGTTRQPSINGVVTIPSALILIPEESKQLLPKEGEARLLDHVVVDTTITIAAPSDSVPEEPVRRGDVNVTIKIPDSFFIRGRGLDLEMQGELKVTDNLLHPTVVGELRARQGKLILLGRTLDLERGTVVFKGGDELSPTLDVALSADIEGTRITILCTGTADKPKLSLVSSPRMNEDDIVAVLLFGRSFNDLSSDQAGLVQNRMGEMVTALGAAALRKNISGVDVVSYQGAGTGERASSLTFGKYLNPNVLLSYIYSLDDPERESFVSLEYFLTGSFKVDTVAGKQSQAGLGIGWKKNF